MRIRLSRGTLAGSVAALVIMGSGCGGGGDATKAEFVDHAVEISDAAGDAAQEARVRDVFECVWPDIESDEELLGRFMDADEIDEDLSADMSKLMVPCVTGGDEPAAP